MHDMITMVLVFWTDSVHTSE